MTTDTNRLARARAFSIEYEFTNTNEYESPLEAEVELLVTFAEREVNAAVEAERLKIFTAINDRLNRSKAHHDFGERIEDWFETEFAQELQPKEEQDA